MSTIQLLFFSTPNCSICHDVKPKLEAAVKALDYPVKWTAIDASLEKELAASKRIFTAPVVILEIDNKETHRFIRVFAVEDVITKIQRYMDLMG